MDPKAEKERRLARAKEIAQLAKTGAPVPALYAASDTFFPPRPLVKKDAAEMARIYGKEDATE